MFIPLTSDQKVTKRLEWQFLMFSNFSDNINPDTQLSLLPFVEAVLIDWEHWEGHHRPTITLVTYISHMILSLMGWMAYNNRNRKQNTLLYVVWYPLPLDNNINLINQHVRHLTEKRQYMTVGKKQTIWSSICTGQISVGIYKVINIFVSEYCWCHETQQRVELAEIVLYWCASQQHSVIELHLTNHTQRRHYTTCGYHTQYTCTTVLQAVFQFICVSLYPSKGLNFYNSIFADWKYSRTSKQQFQTMPKLVTLQMELKK